MATIKVLKKLQEDSDKLVAIDLLDDDTNGPSGLTSLVTQNVVYVAKNGNDLTGTRNRLDKPFLTLPAAAAALLSGDTLWVFPGVYSTPTTVTVTDANIYLEDAIIDLGNNPGPLFFLNSTTNTTYSLFGTGSLKGKTTSGSSLVQTNGQWFVYLKNVIGNNTGNPSTPVFSIVGSLTATIYEKTQWFGVGAGQGLFVFGSTSVNNRFFFKSRSLDTSTTLGSTFKGKAQLQIDNMFGSLAECFSFVTGATGSFVLRDTQMTLPGDQNSYGITINNGVTPEIILWNTVIYLPDGSGPNNGNAVFADNPNTPVYFYGINQSNKAVNGNVVEKVGTLTQDTNLVFPTY